MEFDGFLIAEKQRHVEETCCWYHLNTVKKNPSMLLLVNFKGAFVDNLTKFWTTLLSNAKREACAERALWLCTLGLCIGCNERHDSTFGQSIDPKERHVCTDWLFSVHKIIPKIWV